MTILLVFELNQTSFAGSVSFLFMKVLETNFREVNMGSAEYIKMSRESKGEK